MCPDGFFIFTDHSNLVFLYEPEKSSFHQNKNALSKVHGWGTLLSNFEYSIVHIGGEDNCWADRLSRWGPSAKSDNLSMGKTQHFRLSKLFSSHISISLDPDFKSPTSQAAIPASEFGRLKRRNGL